jgi:hypothetical protein
MPVALISLLIGTEDVPIASGENPPPRGKPKRPSIYLAPIIFLSILYTGKVAVNQKNQSERSGIALILPKTFTYQ